MRAAEDDEIENCIADTLTSSLKETDRDIIVITFSTAGLFLKPALVTIANQGLDLNRIIGVSAISLPLGVRRPENEVLARLVEFVEHYGPTKPIAHIGDYIWIKIAARRPEGNTPTKLNDIPQTEWYPLRATATIIAQGLKLRDSSLLPASLSTTPQLVIHGSRDGKCPPGPVWKLVETLIANGHRIQQLELPGSGHAVPLGKDAALFEEKFIKWCETVLRNQNLESL
jgi:pimeloyl-ACP methyl ester carboxylesterase